MLGGFHTALLSAAGRLFMAGQNDRGQLGLGHRASSRTPSHVPVPGGHPVTAVALATCHSAFLAAGALYVFGCNTGGQLGLGDTRDRRAPVRVRAPNGRPVTAVTLGHAATAFLAGAQWYAMGGAGLCPFWFLDDRPATPRPVHLPNDEPLLTLVLEEVPFRPSCTRDGLLCR